MSVNAKSGVPSLYGIIARREQPVPPVIFDRNLIESLRGE
jgi:hypothetical protein